MKTNKWLKILSLVVLCVGLATTHANAQFKQKENNDSEVKTTKSSKSKSKSKAKSTPQKSESETDAYFDESGGFAHRFWYGGGFNLNMGGSRNYNSFRFGLTPMIGYKIIGEFSVGLRFGIDYSYIKGLTNYNTTASFNVTNYSAGVFSRYKFGNFFLHGEFMNDWVKNIYVDGNDLIVLNSDKSLLVQKETWQSPSLGAGYTSGGAVGYEILLLYNFRVAKDNTTLQLPIDIRFGLNYKF